MNKKLNGARVVYSEKNKLDSFKLIFSLKLFPKKSFAKERVVKEIEVVMD